MRSTRRITAQRSFVLSVLLVLVGVGAALAKETKTVHVTVLDGPGGNPVVGATVVWHGGVQGGTCTSTPDISVPGTNSACLGLELPGGPILTDAAGKADVILICEGSNTGTCDFILGATSPGCQFTDQKNVSLACCDVDVTTQVDHTLVLQPEVPPPAGPTTDHYKGYALNPSISVAIPLLVKDQFGESEILLTSLEKLGTPLLSKFCSSFAPPWTCGSFIRNPPETRFPDHLNWYRFFESQPERTVRVENQFGRDNQKWTLGDAHFLLVPSDKDGEGIELNQHYKCYEATGPDPNVTVALGDQFFGLGGTLDVGPPRYLCNPAEKTILVGPGSDSGPPPLPTVHLACYEYLNSVIQGIPVELVDQLIDPASYLTNVMDWELLCVPSAKVLNLPAMGAPGFAALISLLLATGVAVWWVTRRRAEVSA